MKFPFRAFKFGQLLLSWTNQAANAPLVDSCSSRDQEGNRYKGKCILLTPWRRNKYNESLPQPALVIAWCINQANFGVKPSEARSGE